MVNLRAAGSKSLVLLFFLFSFIAGGASPALAGEVPQVEWEKTFGGDGSDHGYSVSQTSDGGYIITGFTFVKAGNGDVYLLKVDAAGNRQWEKTFGGDKYDVGKSVQQTSDWGYVIAGNTASFSSKENEIFLIKTDPSGNTVWEKSISGDGDYYGESVRQTGDGGFMVAGTVSSDHRDYDIYLMKTDASGKKIWEKRFGGEEIDSCHAMQLTSDGGCIIAGHTYSFGSAWNDVYLIKTDASGNMIWEKIVGGKGYDWGYSVLQTGDGGFIIAGRTSSFGKGDHAAYLIKTDASGNRIWEKNLGGDGDDSGYSVALSGDGGYIVTGITSSFGNGRSAAYAVKTDASGNKIWEKHFEGDGTVSGQQVCSCRDGGFVIVGGKAMEKGTPHKNDDVALIKLKTVKTTEASPQIPPVRVFINGSLINLEVPPVIESGRALVPFRAIGEALGAGVDWDGTNRTVTLTRAGTVIRLKIGDPAALVNNRAIILDAPAVIVNGRTLVPLRFIGESLGADVLWDGDQRAISIKFGIS